MLRRQDNVVWKQRSDSLARPGEKNRVSDAEGSLLEPQFDW